MLARPLRGDDWPLIWAFMRPILAAGDTYCWPADSTQDAARAWWTGKPGGRVYVAELEDGAIGGTAELHPNAPAAGSHVANAGFMVDPAFAGRGIGRSLAEHVLVEAKTRGFRAMQFNAVVETNEHAVKLWQSLGFQILATVPGAFAHPRRGDVGLHVMWRSLL